VGEKFHRSIETASCFWSAAPQLPASDFASVAPLLGLSSIQQTSIRHIKMQSQSGGTVS
jgi:hypothetical protein